MFNQLNKSIFMYIPFLAASAASAIFTVYKTYTSTVTYNSGGLMRQKGTLAKTTLLTQADKLHQEFNNFAKYSTASQEMVTKIANKFAKNSFEKIVNPVLKGVDSAAEALVAYIQDGYGVIQQFLSSPEAQAAKGYGTLVESIPTQQELLNHMPDIQNMAKLPQANYVPSVVGTAATAIFAGLGYSTKDSDSKGLAGTQDED